MDPGIGFGKTPDQNLELIRRLGELLSAGRPVLVGVSRKSTLGKVLGDPAANDRERLRLRRGRGHRRSSVEPGCCGRTTCAETVEALAGRGCCGAWNGDRYDDRARRPGRLRASRVPRRGATARAEVSRRSLGRRSDERGDRERPNRGHRRLSADRRSRAGGLRRAGASSARRPRRRRRRRHPRALRHGGACSCARPQARRRAGSAGRLCGRRRRALAA